MTELIRYQHADGIVTITPVAADEALRLGLVTEVVQPERVYPMACELARDLRGRTVGGRRDAPGGAGGRGRGRRYRGRAQ